MKFAVQKQELLSALKTPSGVTGDGITVCLCLRLKDAELSVVGTNRETWIETRTEVRGSEDGEVLLVGKVLTSVVKALPDGMVEISCENADETDDVDDTKKDGKRLITLSSGGSEFELAIWDGELPEIADEEMGDPCDIDPAEAGAIFQQVAVAAGTDDHRQVLTGARISAEGGQVEMAATDSYRLSLRDLPNLADAVGDADPLVPAATLRKVADVMDDADSAQVRMGERSVEFIIGDTTVSSTLIVGEYPNYRNLIPTEWAHEVTVSREALITAVKQAGLIASQSDSPVVLDIGDEMIVVSAQCTDVGEVSAEVDVSHEGEPIRVAFNPKYLVDGLGTFNCEEVLLKLNDPLKPATINDPDKPGGKYLMMPVRVNS